MRSLLAFLSYSYTHAAVSSSLPCLSSPRSEQKQTALLIGLDHHVTPMTNLEDTIMDEDNRNMNQLLADLYMKEQLIRVKGAATSAASLKASDMDDIKLKIDTLVARLQLS
jgi:hypothetical protein